MATTKTAGTTPRRTTEKPTARRSASTESTERELRRYERRGASARTRFERQVRRSRKRFERFVSAAQARLSRLP